MDDSNVLQNLRLRDLALALGMEPPSEGLGLRIEQDRDKRWWLIGCAEGDCVLPRSQRQPTVADALDAAEAWLAPEMERLKESKA